MARQLVALSGGSLEVTADRGQGRPFGAKLCFPAMEQVGVLVIDDNAETLRPHGPRAGAHPARRARRRLRTNRESTRLVESAR